MNNDFFVLVKRNTKLFFKDKGLFFCALIAPLIILVLFITFLGKVFKDSFKLSLNGFPVEESLIDGTVGAELLATLLAVSCVTVAFTCNMLMVQDKITGARRDLLITPVKKSVLDISYYVATVLSTLLICVIATLVCFIYLAFVGWYLSFGDCMLIFLDTFLLTMFGTVLSSIVNHFLNTQGAVSAVGTIVGSLYGFISGAYMPIASFDEGLRNTLMFLPSTYCSSIIKNHALAGAFREFADVGFPPEVIEKIKDSMDCNLYFFGNKVSIGATYGIIIGTITILLGVYILLNFIKFKKRKSVK